MSEFEVEKGIPVVPRRGPARGRKYPFAAMEVGDSFLAPGYARNRINASVYRWKSSHLGQQFAIRAVDDGCIRVWRVA